MRRPRVRSHVIGGHLRSCGTHVTTAQLRAISGELGLATRIAARRHTADVRGGPQVRIPDQVSGAAGQIAGHQAIVVHRTGPIGLRQQLQLGMGCPAKASAKQAESVVLWFMFLIGVRSGQSLVGTTFEAVRHAAFKTNSGQSRRRPVRHPCWPMVGKPRQWHCRIPWIPPDARAVKGHSPRLEVLVPCRRQ